MKIEDFKPGPYIINYDKIIRQDIGNSGNLHYNFIDNNIRFEFIENKNGLKILEEYIQILNDYSIEEFNMPIFVDRSPNYCRINYFDYNQHISNYMRFLMKSNQDRIYLIISNAFDTYLQNYLNNAYIKDRYLFFNTDGNTLVSYKQFELAFRGLV